ncbi:MULTISPECIES: pyrroloquinoline quinone precursor peptide PqqA [Gemmobacter]|jgi:coenzyme PQQ precursor peptide PqqA|uniref:Coenzyme PQQ synthesis protein A n=1 Tax=Gemmobacter caeni TaxID=589035 RepID=A0A2T6AZZ0_9RHOB|nr:MULTISPECIES: pyrroloquinoline quinone precursor peptide PqqA [Gemmobacter]OJY28287.1 MAG: coenzyme PQQ precursor peptide PqqA [Rhodobacterales bacterium 65-51]PTX49367.1 coenzyme PQQ precursor peptide PqqA [Gemmobacter caeni]
MAWKKPTLKEVACGMEINMYGPAEDDRRSDDVI